MKSFIKICILLLLKAIGIILVVSPLVWCVTAVILLSGWWVLLMPCVFLLGMFILCKVDPENFSMDFDMANVIEEEELLP